MAVRNLDMDGIRIWCRNLERERERKGGMSGRKMFKIDFRGGLENAGLYDKGGVAKR